MKNWRAKKGGRPFLGANEMAGKANRARLVTLSETQLLNDLKVSHSCLRVVPGNNGGELFLLLPDWPETLVHVQLRCEEEWCQEAPGGPEQTAWRHG